MEKKCNFNAAVSGAYVINMTSLLMATLIYTVRVPGSQVLVLELELHHWPSWLPNLFQVSLLKVTSFPTFHTLHMYSTFKQ